MHCIKFVPETTNLYLNSNL